MAHRRFCLTTCLPIVGTLVACSSASYQADADDEVHRTLREATEQVLGNRESWLVLPTKVEPAPLPPPTPTVPSGDADSKPPTDAGNPATGNPATGNPATGNPATGNPGTVTPPHPVAGDPATDDPAKSEPATTTTTSPPEVLDLAATLALAVRQNREFLTRRESLYREGLSISLTRFQFGPQFNAAVSYVWPRSQNGFEAHQLGTNLSAQQILPTGGTFGVSAALDANWPYGSGSADPNYGSRVGFSLSQPLLRGAGYDISHEALTQAERQLTYAIRDFELFRENFTINIAQRFFELGSQRKTLANEDTNYEAAVFDRGKAEALQQVGRNSEQEVFRARRREIEAKDQLINAHAAYDRAVDSFKILLGVPTTTTLDIADMEPPYEPVSFEVGSAITAALHNRLDLITERQNVEDAERALRIAENGLLPDLNLSANYGLSGNGNELGRAGPDQWSSSLALSFEVPLQRKSQRNSYVSSLISLEQSRRNLQLREDQLELDIRDAVRSLRSIEERITLQEEQIKQERGAVTVTKIRYEAGDLDNRDLLEARQAFVNAQNALIQLKVSHFVARLNLLRDMGLFFVDDQGMWR